MEEESHERDTERRNLRRLIGASAVSNLGDGISQVAYPWLASAVTRNPLLIALVAVVQRLPWLIATLPVGVLTDRRDRRRLMIAANSSRAVVTLAVAAAVLGLGGNLPGVDEVEAVTSTNVGLYVAVLVATLLLGFGEVVHDNAAQSFLPSVVTGSRLERANGRLYAVELVGNQFAGPPLGGLLLAVAFAVPFFVDAGSFAVAAALVAVIRPPRSLVNVAAAGSAGTAGAPAVASWRVELREGLRWLWGHDLLRPLALTLGGTNLLSAMSTAAFVLFAQDVLGASATQFSLLLVIGGVGGMVSGLVAGRATERLGAGVVVRLSLVTFTVVTIAVGMVSHWWLAALILAVEFFVVVLWNVTTVSLRQSIVPDRLLGRVNSVYRFFGWGTIPVGAALGGAIVAIADGPLSRTAALRLPWFVASAGYLVLIGAYAWRRLTPAAIAAARSAGPVEVTPET